MTKDWTIVIHVGNTSLKYIGPSRGRGPFRGFEEAEKFRLQVQDEVDELEERIERGLSGGTYDPSALTLDAFIRDRLCAALDSGKYTYSSGAAAGDAYAIVQLPCGLEVSVRGYWLGGLCVERDGT